MKIFIDPGHGGKDPGAIGPKGLKESDTNLKIALGVGKLLQSHGIQIIYRRTTDAFNDLDDISGLANTSGANYFVSIHCNSSQDSEVDGTETFSLKPGGEGEALAKAIQNALVNGTGLKNRGVKYANFSVLRKTVMPAVLIEVAFISNPNAEQLLSDESFLNKVEQAIAQGICNYVGIEFNAPEVVVPPEVKTKDYQTHWAKNDIEFCMNEGIFMKTDKFRPDDPLTRAEAAAIIARLLRTSIISGED